jgi:hypothetical protein
MPRRKQPPRLYLRRARRNKHGKLRASAVWIILDGGKHIATGCVKGEDRAAQQALSAYIAAKYKPARKERDIEAVDVADVLSIYDDDTRDRQVNKAKFDERLRRLNDFWGGRMLSEVTGETCRAYVSTRGNDGGARRDLEDLRAALNHHAAEGFHRGVVRVVLPTKGLPRDRWLTRDEAAKLIWTCWRHRDAGSPSRHRQGPKAANRQTPVTPSRPLLTHWALHRNESGGHCIGLTCSTAGALSSTLTGESSIGWRKAS